LIKIKQSLSARVTLTTSTASGSRETEQRGPIMGRTETFGNFASVSAVALAAGTLAVASVIALAATLAASRPAEARPAFASQTGKTCTACHTAPPQLNTYGKAFKAAGNKEPKK
jgi:hypothetical protein